MVEQIKRKRGGQQGNRNALKHGYYSKIFNKTERADYCSAGDIEGIDEEIALLRHVIKKAASSGDDNILIRASSALNKLIRTRHKIMSGRYDGFKNAVRNVIEDILIPMGVDIGSAALINRISDENQTNNGQNKAALP
jgi:hypothetical protein